MSRTKHIAPKTVKVPVKALLWFESKLEASLNFIRDLIKQVKEGEEWLTVNGADWWKFKGGLSTGHNAAYRPVVYKPGETGYVQWPSIDGRTRQSKAEKEVLTKIIENVTSEIAQVKAEKDAMAKQIEDLKRQLSKSH